MSQFHFYIAYCYDYNTNARKSKYNKINIEKFSMKRKKRATPFEAARLLDH